MLSNSIETQLSTSELFRLFIEAKKPELWASTISKYRSLLIHIEQSELASIPVNQVDEKTAQRFLMRLSKSCKPSSIKDRLILLSSCWNFYDIEPNYWAMLVKRMKPQQQQPAKPFTKHEINMILDVFSEYHPEFYPLICTMMQLGLRSGEAFGLRWRHINWDNCTVWIGESYSSRCFKGTKTGNSRVLPLKGKLYGILKEYKKWMQPESEDDLVFQMNGKPIDNSNFVKLYWKPVLEECGVEYRTLYNCRHTFLSHCVAEGLSVAEVSALAGSSKATILKHYIECVANTRVPEIF